MGQTLTHGVYLPDEGERNCYSGLAANWQLLDGAVGTVAEHTTALSGKAPLVHTHTKSDITDFPAYGTAAGTICEGNDSRLSDARTPVAHTHTKSDVTDLLNSNFIPSANNAYDLGSSSYQWNGIYANAYYSQSASAELGVTGGTVPILFTDKNSKKLAGITLGNYVSSKLSYNRFSIYDKDSNNQELEEYLEFAFLSNNQTCYFRPKTTDKVNLGSSSFQWNNLYAKNYYYNGVAWGLDKENTWSKTNYFSPSMYQKAFTARASTPSSNEFATFIISDSNNASVMSLNYANRTTGVRDLSLRVYSQSGDVNGVKVDKDANNNYSFCSINPNNTIELGTSTNKWTTLNGVNPGALSIPSSDSADYIDLSSNLSTNAEYQYTAPFDGWLCLYVIVNEFYTENAIGLYRSDTSANSHQWAKSVTAALNLYKQTRYQGSVMLPVESGKKYICYLSLNANTTVHFKYLFFYKNKGNV